MLHTPRARRIVLAALALAAAASLPAAADPALPDLDQIVSPGAPLPDANRLLQHATTADYFTPSRVLQENEHMFKAEGLNFALRQVYGQFAFSGTGDTYAIAEITIHHPAGALAPTHVPPGAGSTPSAWNCSDSNVASVYSVTCTPNITAPSGDWVCPSPYVLASYFGSPLDTHEGTSDCGGTSVTCSPQQTPLVQNFCEDHASGPASMSFSCEANYSGILTTVEWSVLCRTYHTVPAAAAATGTIR